MSVQWVWRLGRSSNSLHITSPGYVIIPPTPYDSGRRAKVSPEARCPLHSGERFNGDPELDVTWAWGSRGGRGEVNQNYQIERCLDLSSLCSALVLNPCSVPNNVSVTQAPTSLHHLVPSTTMTEVFTSLSPFSSSHVFAMVRCSLGFGQRTHSARRRSSMSWATSHVTCETVPSDNPNWRHVCRTGRFPPSLHKNMAILSQGSNIRPLGPFLHMSVVPYSFRTNSANVVFLRNQHNKMYARIQLQICFTS